VFLTVLRIVDKTAPSRPVPSSGNKPGMRKEDGTVSEKTPEESDDVQTPLENGIKSEKPDGIKWVFLTVSSRKERNIPERECRITPCLKAGLRMFCD